MLERVSDYVKTLTQKDPTAYELAARVCATYFDERGIDTPTAEDWKAFERDYPLQYQREKGNELKTRTLQNNYVARGKAFYRWCEEQDGSHQTAPLFEEDKTEAISPPLEQQQKGKSLRVNFLLNEDTHSALMSLVYLKGQTLTAILTEAIEKYIHGYSEEIATLEETRRKLRSK